jgi:putative sterol carrier protein
MKFVDGEVTEVRELAAEEKTDYTLEGPYEIWTKLNKGEMDAQSALMTRQLPFKGNMSTIIRYSKAFLRLFEVMQTVPVEY